MGPVESLALPLRCAGRHGHVWHVRGEDNSGRTVTGSVTVLLKWNVAGNAGRNAKRVCQCELSGAVTDHQKSERE